MSTSQTSAQRYPPADTIDLAGINFVRTVHVDEGRIMPNGISKSRGNRSVSPNIQYCSTLFQLNVMQSQVELENRSLADTKDAVSESYMMSAA
jgi:hypothetical protein